MPTRTFTKESVYMAFYEGESEDGSFKKVHEGKWRDEGKYSYREQVLQATDDGKFYSYTESRSGSYFTDYTYSWEWEKDKIMLTEVHEVERAIKTWEAVL